MHRETRTLRGESGFVVGLAARDTSVSEARFAFATWLRDFADDEAVHDMAVVLSELATNATASAAEGTAGEIRAHVHGDELHLQVSNAVGDADVRRWDLDDPLRGGGRGLVIVRAYTDSMEIETVDGSVTVRCVRRLNKEP